VDSKRARYIGELNAILPTDRAQRATSQEPTSRDLVETAKRGTLMLRNWIAGTALSLALVTGLAQSAAAEIPDAKTLLADIGFTPDQIAQVQAGSFVSADIKASTERELVAAFAFLVHATPADFVKQLRSGLLVQADPTTLATEVVAGAPTLASFAKLTLAPDAAKRAQAYASAKPGGDLNLSSAEIASFNQLGSGATTAAVEQAVRSALLARLQAYQTKGLAGIAPYAGAGGKPRSPGDELRSATQATKRLQSLVPAAYQYLLDYPAAKPAGSEEAFRWSQFLANKVPTLALTHGLFVPDGDAWVVVQRQFYVSGGYNSEQAIGALLPMQTGTLVIYTNRTSTDQVTGFGGGAKRSIGSSLLASQLQDLYKKVQTKGKAGGG
jgi:hypothetical protein